MDVSGLDAKEYYRLIREETLSLDEKIPEHCPPDALKKRHPGQDSAPMDMNTNKQDK